MAMQQQWPEYDESKTVASHVEMAVQVLGKLKGTINVPVDSEQDFVVETAKQNEKVARAIDGKSIVKVILVRNKLVNLIVKQKISWILTDSRKKHLTRFGLFTIIIKPIMLALKAAWI